jgi:hypothetical protein
MSKSPVTITRTRISILLISLLLGSALTAAPAAASAVINGTLSNFDTFNDTGLPTHGFEIELEGVHAADVQYFFGAPYNRYGTPTVVEFTDGARWGSKVRWESTYDQANGYAATTAMAPANPTPTNAHECYLGGPAGSTQALYDSSGCEHFGIGLYGNPTATTYQWLVDDGTNTGKLTYANSPVNIPPVSWQANAGNVAAVVPALPPAPVAALPAVPDCALWGTATWMKIYVTEAPEPAQLGNLLTGDSNVPQEPGQVETEWQFLQGRPTCDDTGAPLAVQPDNELINEAAAGGGSESVTRRYEFYAYTGAYDDTDGGNHEALPLCDSDPFRQACGDPAQAQPNADLGAYQGAQMVAANLMLAGVAAPTLNVTRSGDGTGIVSDGGGVSCGDLCGGSYAQDAQITLTATPDQGSHVVGWSIPSCGSSTTCSITMSNDTVVDVQFGVGDAPAPTITSFSPSSAPAGSQVVVRGTSLSADSVVSINGVSAQVVDATGVSLTFTVPCGAGKGAIALTNSGGTIQSLTQFTQTFPNTKIARISPTSALVGTTITATGTGLLCLQSVAIGTKSSAFTAVSQSTMRFTVPDSASSDTVRLVTELSKAVVGPKLTVVYPPELLTFAPSHAYPGGTVTVVGRNLSTATKIAINGLALTSVKFVSSTQMTGVLPANSVSGLLRVTNPYGSAVSATEILVDVRAPVVSKLTPARGGPGTAVVVTGKNFQPGMSAWLHGNPVSISYLSATSAVVAIPSGQTSGTLIVENAGGQSSASPTFTALSTLAIPRVTKVSSMLVSPSSVVTVTGTNLGAATSITISGLAASFVVRTAGSVSVTIPSEATTSALSIRTAGGVVWTPQITVD